MHALLKYLKLNNRNRTSFQNLLVLEVCLVCSMRGVVLPPVVTNVICAVNTADVNVICSDP